METVLPRAVQQQLEHAEALERQLSGTSTPPEGTPIEQQPTTDAAAPPAGTHAETAVQPPSDDGYRTRYDVLAGKYNAEVPRLHQQLRDAESRLNAALQRALDAESRPSATPKVEGLDQKDKDDFGVDLVDMVQRVALATSRQVGEALAADLRKEFGTVRGQVERVVEHQAQTQVDRLWGEVKAVVPDWDAIDHDPLWVQWLDTRARGSSRTYRELARSAIERGEAQPIAELVALWNEQLPKPSVKPSSKSELSRQVVPNTAQGAAAPAQARQWTREEYSKAFDPRNRYSMTQPRWDTLMAEADTALAEGRVR